MLAKKALHSILAVLLLSLTSYAMAGQLRTDDGYVIYYNALNTTMLPKNVARAYGIVRSKNRAMLNVSVRKGSKGSLMQTGPALAKVTAQATNLTGQLKNLNMRRIEEGKADDKAIYYIAVFTITNKETLDFTINVDPENQGKEQKIEFRQQFFAD
jgi:hypothetical protein